MRLGYSVHKWSRFEILLHISSCGPRLKLVVRTTRPRRPSGSGGQSEYGANADTRTVGVTVHDLQFGGIVEGITLGTARSHLTKIFDKTGAARQAELVRLLLQK